METNYDFLYIYEGNSSAANSLATLTGQDVPSNITSCSNQMHVEFVSDNIFTTPGFFANIHIQEGNCTNAQPGEIGYCTDENPCDVDGGHCESNNQCGNGLYCGFNNCPPELGFQNGTNCCFSRALWCGELVTTHNSGWSLQTPNNTLNRHVADIACQYYFNTGITGLVVSMAMKTFEVDMTLIFLMKGF